MRVGIAVDGVHHWRAYAISMLRGLDRDGALSDLVLLHSARSADAVIFRRGLRDLARRREGFRLHEQLTSAMGRIGPGDLNRLCPDWRERETFLSGPAAMLEATSEHFKAELGHCDRLHLEHFQPYLDGRAGETVRTCINAPEGPVEIEL